MSTTIHLSFPCSVCTQVIQGDYEEDDFDYPVFCPRCGRQNQVPRPGSADVADTPVAKPKTVEPLPKNRVAWRYRPAASERPMVPLRNCVAVDGQGRLMAALGAELVCLIPHDADCEVAWKFSVADLIPGSPVIGPDGICCVHRPWARFVAGR